MSVEELKRGVSGASPTETPCYIKRGTDFGKNGRAVYKAGGVFSSSMSESSAGRESYQKGFFFAGGQPTSYSAAGGKKRRAPLNDERRVRFMH